VTVESLRADRLAGTEPAPDPFPSLRARAGGKGIRRLMASSSDTLPALASLFTGTSPARHGTMIEGVDRLPADLPTLATLLGAGGYRTAGYPSMSGLGLASGLSRGFQSYGWPVGDLLGQESTVETDRQGWRPDVGRRAGQAAITDALRWTQRHSSEKLFLWVHLAEAAPPYATDKALVEPFQSSMYDAALAYEDRCIESLIAGFTQLGIADRTTFVIAGDHGESLGAHGESFHGLNLYTPALETVVVLLPAKGAAPGNGSGSAAQGRGRLQDLFGSILTIAGIPLPQGSEAALELPSISPERPLLAATLGPRAAFGWNGAIAFSDGASIWTGPADETVFQMAEAPSGLETMGDLKTAPALRERALAAAGPLAKRLAGRSAIPGPEDRQKVLEGLRAAASARDGRDTVHEKQALEQAWKIDPGNFEVARWLAKANGVQSKDNAALTRLVEERSGGMTEGLLAVARIQEIDPKSVETLDTMKRACRNAGAGCAVDLALRLGRSGKNEEAVEVLAPRAETEKDADIWKTVGDLYFAIENTHRAEKAYESAASLRPNDPDIILRQGDCLLAVRDMKGAKAKYEEARRVLPDLPDVEMKLGVLSRQAGDTAGAVEHFRKGIGVDPNTVPGTIALGRLLAEQGMTAEALKLFLDAASRDTGSSEGLYYAAEATASAGDLKSAETYLKQALERDPTNGPALYQLARLQAYAGDRKSAGLTLEKLAHSATTDIAVAALRDPLFTNDAPGNPLGKGMQALYELVKGSMRGGEGVLVVPSAPANSPPAPGKP